MQYSFGLGHLYATRTDIANSTPREFGILQECSLDFDTPLALLYGANMFPVAAGRKKSKIAGKAKFGQINGRIFNDFFFNGVVTTGAQILTADSEAGTGVIPATPFQLTVANSATFLDDLGVVAATNATAGTLKAGMRFEKVAAGPTTGQYSVAAGIYTFAAADVGATVLFSYSYQPASPAVPIMKGTLPNLVMTSPPTFQLVWHEVFLGKHVLIKAPNCVSEKLAWPLKQEDFQISELDFQVLDDQTGNMLTYSMAE